MRYCEQYKTFGAFVLWFKTTTRRVCRPVLELSTLTRKGGYLVIVTIYRVVFSLLFLLPEALERIYGKARASHHVWVVFFLLPVREVIRFFPLLLCTGPLVLEFNWCEDKFKKQISWHCCNLWKSVSHMIGENWFGPSFPTAPRPVSQRGANHCVTCYTMWLIVVQDYQNFVNLVKSLLPVTTVLVLVKCFIG